MQGYLPKLGDLTERGLLHWPLRLGFIIGGLFLAMPHNPYILMTEQTLFILSFGVIAASVAVALMHRRLVPA